MPALGSRMGQWFTRPSRPATGGRQTRGPPWRNRGRHARNRGTSRVTDELRATAGLPALPRERPPLRGLPRPSAVE